MENEIPPPPRPPLARVAYVPLVAPTILAAVFNLAAPSMTGGPTRPNEIVMLLVGGVIAGQIGLLATWAVLGPWRLYAQWFVALLLWLGLLLALVLGIAMVEPRPFGPGGNELLKGILGYSAVLVAAQVPLWSIRLLRGWRLVPRGADAARTAIASRQLQIRDILIAMTILALALGTMSLVAKRDGGRHNADFLMEVVAICGVTVVWSALVLPICLWVCFGARSIGVRIVVLIVYLTILATIGLGVVAAVSRRAMLLPPEGLGYVLLLHAALLATVLSGLGLARACGYVLVSVRSARRPPLPATAPPSAPGEEMPV